MERIDVVGYVKGEQQKILGELELITKSDNSGRKERIDKLFVEWENVKKFVHQHVSTMIAYDIRICNEIIKDIEAKICDQRNATKGNSGFKFSFKLNQPNQQTKSTSEKSTPVATDTVDSSSFMSNITGLKNLSDEERILQSSVVDSREVNLELLDNCKVYIHGSPSSLRLLKLKNCGIFCGPVPSSVFVSDCHQCHFHLITQQLRIHDTTECEIYLHVTSRSIIEDSSKLKFGPFNWNYDGLDTDYVRSGIDPSVNNWKEVDDFDCLVKPSPNWSLIE